MNKILVLASVLTVGSLLLTMLVPCKNYTRTVQIVGAEQTGYPYKVNLNQIIKSGDTLIYKDGGHWYKVAVK